MATRSFQAGVLDDEISPGHMTYGDAYQVTLALAKAGGGLARVAANLHNRFAGSVFKFGSDYLAKVFANEEPAVLELRRLNQALGDAASQAREINQLPTLAGALLPLAYTFGFAGR